MLQFKYHPLAEAHLAGGEVVVIDVLRAFTTAAFAFTKGVSRIYPVAGVEEALTLRSRLDDTLAMGEVDGLKPEGFDFSNSPSEILNADIAGKTLIQRTSAGTQGLIRAVNADRCYAASFVVSRATAVHLRKLKPDLVSFVITGESLGRDGDEDRACGEYIEALVKDLDPDPADFLAKVDDSTVGRSFLGGRLKYLMEDDLKLCKQVDVCDFHLQIDREDDLLVMRKANI